MPIKADAGQQLRCCVAEIGSELLILQRHQPRTEHALPMRCQFCILTIEMADVGETGGEGPALTELVPPDGEADFQRIAPKVDHDGIGEHLRDETGCLKIQRVLVDDEGCARAQREIG